MKKPLFSERTVTNLQAVLVLAGFLALLVAVPHRWLRPLSVAVVLLAVSAALGIRASVGRLQAAARMLAANADAPPEGLLAAMLTSTERRLLRLPPRPTSAEAIALLRARQSTLVSLGMAFAIPGICAFLVVLFFFAE